MNLHKPPKPMVPLEPGAWYWIRKANGSLAPYRFYRLQSRRSPQGWCAEFYVGSMLQAWPLSSIVARAEMPGNSL